MTLKKISKIAALSSTIFLISVSHSIADENYKNKEGFCLKSIESSIESGVSEKMQLFNSFNDIGGCDIDNYNTVELNNGIDIIYDTKVTGHLVSFEGENVSVGIVSHGVVNCNGASNCAQGDTASAAMAIIVSNGDCSNVKRFPLKSHRPITKYYKLNDCVSTNSECTRKLNSNVDVSLKYTKEGPYLLNRFEKDGKKHTSVYGILNKKDCVIIHD